jgi:hypothetical protein
MIWQILSQTALDEELRHQARQDAIAKFIGVVGLCAIAVGVLFIVIRSAVRAALRDHEQRKP